MPKAKPHKGLLKRIRVTKSGRIKFGRAFGRHLKSHKSGKLLRSYRKPAYASPSDTKRLLPMLVGRVRVARPQQGAEVETKQSAE